MPDLIVNADDFGQSPGVNRGIIQAHVDGIVTSTSLMVRWPAATEAAALSRQHPALDVGLHLDLGEWTLRDWTWVTVYEVVPTDDGAAVAREVDRQLETFRRLMGTGPTHIDSHQHVHRNEPVRSVVLARASSLGVPVRHCDPRIQYCGGFYGLTEDGRAQPAAISVMRLIEILKALPPGLTELCCHPAAGDDLNTLYRAGRAVELTTLCDPRVRQAITNLDIQLKSFRGL